MPSICMEWRSAHKTNGFRRSVRGLAPVEAHQRFPAYVDQVAKMNGYEVLDRTPMEATLGLTVCGKPVTHLYCYIEPHTPPTAAEPGQPKRTKA